MRECLCRNCGNTILCHTVPMVSGPQSEIHSGCVIDVDCQKCGAKNVITIDVETPGLPPVLCGSDVRPV